MKIIPVEVKSGLSGSLKSLHQFVHEKRSSMVLRFDLNPPSIQWVKVWIKTSNAVEQIEYRLASLPLYAVEKCGDVLDSGSRD